MQLYSNNVYQLNIFYDFFLIILFVVYFFFHMKMFNTINLSVQ